MVASALLAARALVPAMFVWPLVEVVSGETFRLVAEVCGGVDSDSGIVGGGLLDEFPLLSADCCCCDGRDGVASGEELTRVRRLGLCEAADNVDEGV